MLVIVVGVQINISRCGFFYICRKGGHEKSFGNVIRDEDTLTIKEPTVNNGSEVKKDENVGKEPEEGLFMPYNKLFRVDMPIVLPGTEGKCTVKVTYHRGDRGSVNKDSKVYCVGDFCAWKKEGIVEMKYSEEEDFFDNKRCCFIGSIPVKPGCSTRYLFIVDGKLDYSSDGDSTRDEPSGIVFNKVSVDPMK